MKRLNGSLTEEIVRRDYSRVEAKLIMALLSREDGFSVAGEYSILYLAHIAKESKVPMAWVFILLNKTWEKSWQFQNLAVRGDPSVPGKLGKENQAILDNFIRIFQEQPIKRNESEKKIA